MLIIGHRGAAGLEAENTISSFQKAQSLNVDMIETDLRLQNSKIVLSHSKPKPGVKYTTLEELLQTAKVPLNLEIKESGFEEEVLKAINGFAYKVVITSWNPRVLKKIRALDTNILLGPVFHLKDQEWFLPILIWYLKNINIYSISIVPELVNKQTVEWFKQAGWKVFPFTINNMQEFDRLKNLGVDGIFTDYPNKFINQIWSRQQSTTKQGKKSRISN